MRPRASRPQLKRDSLGGYHPLAPSRNTQATGFETKPSASALPIRCREIAPGSVTPRPRVPVSRTDCAPRHSKQLKSTDSDQVARALAALAVVGTVDDVPVLRRVATRGATLETEARAAINEIENAAAVGRDPLQVLNGPTFRVRLVRVVAGVFGTGSVVIAIAAFSRAFLHHTDLHLPQILRGVSVFGFGIWLLWIARRGKLPHEDGGV